MTAPPHISEDASQRSFKKDVLLYLLGFLVMVLVEIGLAFWLEGYYAEWVPEAPRHIARAMLIAFVAGLAVSVVMGIGTIRAIGDAITRRVRAEGSLVSRQGFLSHDFGMALFLTIWVAASFAVTKLCDPIVTLDESHEALGRVSCYLVGKSALTFLGGLTVGLLTWVYFWAVRFEKATNSQIIVTRYSSKKWSLAQLLGIGAAVLFVIVLVFYRLFTLGQQ